jgi:hypothetical protein
MEMTEHLELRIPVQDVRLALICPKCKTEVILDPGQVNRERFQSPQPKPMTCPACDFLIDSKFVKAVGHFLMAIEGISAGEMVFVARRTSLA